MCLLLLRGTLWPVRVSFLVQCKIKKKHYCVSALFPNPCLSHGRGPVMEVVCLCWCDHVVAVVGLHPASPLLAYEEEDTCSSFSAALI